jgi:hypothetical protein
MQKAIEYSVNDKDTFKHRVNALDAIDSLTSDPRQGTVKGFLICTPLPLITRLTF